ncbi:rod shape-determining protein MreC [Sphaerotilus sp.]|uniref:rod shape-determining protein MreC n=1 Tax=Sphaerotilus sp. TaxID=2093942 RepID=UPI002600F76A|nr:rod shape-determining protein MreC [Sphaerotilus sp.]
MPLGTLDRSPPPFFRQGPSALSRLLFFASLSVLLMAADSRVGLTTPLRTAAAVVLHPIERALLVPVRGVGSANEYLSGIAQAQQTTERARAELTRQAERSLQADQLLRENARLRALLELRTRLSVRSRAAEVLYDAPDAYTRKIIIDRGSSQGVQHGSPVINELGVIGQVTRVYPMTSEVTLVVDENAAIPVHNIRTGHRGVAFGDPSVDSMELRFVAANADVQVGDILQTSGLDGVYPPGLPVAKVGRLDRRTQSDFAKIVLIPATSPDSVRHVLVLEPVGIQQPPKPTPADVGLPVHAKDTAPAKSSAKGVRKP